MCIRDSPQCRHLLPQAEDKPHMEETGPITRYSGHLVTCLVVPNFWSLRIPEAWKKEWFLSFYELEEEWIAGGFSGVMVDSWTTFCPLLPQPVLLVQPITVLKIFNRFTRPQPWAKEVEHWFRTMSAKSGTNPALRFMPTKSYRWLHIETATNYLLEILYA